MSFVSYAQNGEDVLLHRVFGGQETGFYVDVGAYHPVEGSVTKAFYDRGWSGINIEPGQIFDDLAAARPRDVNLRMAVLDRTGMVAFSQNPADAGMSQVADGDQAPGSIQVPCDTLENIVRLHSGGRPVDFLKVDAEGAEAAIVASTDWRRFRPRVLVFEATLPWSTTLSNAEWEPALLKDGYVRAYFDGINCYYLPEEEEPILGRHFRVPVNVLDSVQRYDAEAVAQREAAQARIAALDAQCLEARSALAAAKAEAERLRAAERAEAQSRAEAMQADSDARLAGLQAERDARQALMARLAQEQSAVQVLARRSGELEGQLVAVYASTSWRITAPLRSFSRVSRWILHGTWAWLTLQPGSRPRRVARRVTVSVANRLDAYPRMMDLTTQLLRPFPRLLSHVAGHADALPPRPVAGEQRADTEQNAFVALMTAAERWKGAKRVIS